MLGLLEWPKNFMNIGGKTFEWTFVHKKEFVDFCLREMGSPTGLFKKFQEYCIRMSK